MQIPRSTGPQGKGPSRNSTPQTIRPSQPQGGPTRADPSPGMPNSGPNSGPKWSSPRTSDPGVITQAPRKMSTPRPSGQGGKSWTRSETSGPPIRPSGTSGGGPGKSGNPKGSWTRPTPRGTNANEVAPEIRAPGSKGNPVRPTDPIVRSNGGTPGKTVTAGLPGARSNPTGSGPNGPNSGPNLGSPIGEFATPLGSGKGLVGPRTNSVPGGPTVALTPAAPIGAPIGGSSASLSVGVGIGFGAGFGLSVGFSDCANFLSFSFGSSLCHYDPWVGHCGTGWGWGWCNGYYPYHCSPWYSPWSCGPWYSYSCWPRWNYPSYWSCGWPYYSGYYGYYGYSSWCPVVYSAPQPVYLTSYSYCDTPCAVFSDSVLVPSVTTYDSPVYASDEVPYSPPTAAASSEPGLPAPASATELAGSTGRELGDTYMKLGDVDSAVRVYTRHTSLHPGDVLAVRALGFAYVDLGQTGKGVELVERAYRIDPTLAQRPFDRELLRDPESLTSALDRATVLAAQQEGKPGAAGAYLAIAVLMQADGRDEPARNALDKAKAAGLAAKVAQEMQAALPVGGTP